MARKMGPDGPKLQIREKNGHYYAYTSTSRMVDGRKKTVNECLGRYDPETGTVIPKKPMKSREEYARIRQEREGSIDFSKIGSRSYGASHLLDSIQRRMSLGEDLQRSYAHKAKTIMACAMALAVNPGPFSSIADTLENTYLRDLYGTEMEMTPQNISEFTAALGEYDLSMDSFFESRLTRCNGLVAWDTAANRTYRDAGGMAEQASSTGGNGLNAAKKAMATDMRGIPLLFRFYPGSLSDLATVDRLLDDLKRYERTDAVFVMDSGFTSGSNIRGMIARGTHFVSPAKPDCKAVKTLLTDFRRASEKKALVYGGHAYTVWKTELGLKESGRPSADGAPAYDFTTAADADHGSEGLMAAYVCYDAEKHSDEIQNRELLIDSLTEYARNMDEADPVKAFRKRAGEAAKYFDVTRDGRRVALAPKNNARSFSDSRAGMSVMLCSQDVSWELMMAAYDAKCLTEQAFGTEMSRGIGTGDPDAMKGRYLIQFVSQMLLAEIRATLREKDRDSKYTIEGIMSILSTLAVLEYGGRKGLSEATKNVRHVYELFGIDVPKEPIYHAEMFDLKDIMNPVAKGGSLV